MALTGFAAIDLAEKVRFLQQPLSYPHRPDAVTSVETHMSWVFLAGEFAFKLKKPVRYAFLDFATIESREFNCREEVRLNARLAPDIYLDVVPLRLNYEGKLTFDGSGLLAEWLVKMRRLPHDRMLDWLIEHAKVKPAEVDAAARCLMSFYKTAARVNQSARQVWDRFDLEHKRDAEVLEDSRFDIDHEAVARVLGNAKTALDKVQPMLRARAEQSVYMEGHGDLRPEHICLLQKPVIIDCLEFSRDLRLLDPFDEITFLDLECERLGAAWIGERILTQCRRELVHPPPPELLQFYRAARALLRARLALVHLTEPSPRTPQKWEPRARQYIAFAEEALRIFSSRAA
jgi:aminoglycoside phosphotransferase family enzyme